jgi:hypothetical protein
VRSYSTIDLLSRDLFANQFQFLWDCLESLCDQIGATDTGIVTDPSSIQEDFARIEQSEIVQFFHSLPD